MKLESGHLFVAFVLGLMLSALVAWTVTGLYRRRMVALMRGTPAPDPARMPTTEIGLVAIAHPAPVLDLAANRRARLRLLLALTGTCILIAMTQSWLALRFQFEIASPSVNRVLTLGMVYCWPVVLAWSLVRIWSWSRTILGVAAYMAVTAAVVMLRSNEQQALLPVVNWLASGAGMPIVAILLIGASGRIRAAAPSLLPAFLFLSLGSILGLQVLDFWVRTGTSWFPLVDAIGVMPTQLLFVLAPWIVLAWPVFALGRVIARAYRDKRFSDQGYTFATYWLIVLILGALPAYQGVGLVGVAHLLPWLWIPAGWWALKRWSAPPANPPTLLVLRVFQRDAQVEHLFDQVVERWRHTGNTVLIAGTDLVSRTLDPDDLFAFINGELAQRFIASRDQVAQRLAEFDLAPDPDGRFRVNECYCSDTTWEATLESLVTQSDVVLMDLRGFHAGNHGCRFELGALAKAGHLLRAVLLHDAATDRDTAAAELGGTDAGRFAWIDGGTMDGAKAGEVFEALFGKGDSRGGATATQTNQGG